MTPLVDRLKERKLVQWALAYLAGAWVLLQVFAELRDTFAWPPIIVRAITVLLAVGFLAALVLAWYHGEKGRQRVSGPELLMLSGILMLAGVGVAWVGRDAGATPSGTVQARGTALPASAAEADRRSVAVLPFDNLSRDPDNEYFSDGITDEILTTLANVSDLRVISRTSVMQYKGSNKPLRQIASELGVAHILEGSVQRAENQVRINAQLIDARTDVHLWAQRFDRPLQDIFAVQSEIAQQIAQALQAELSPAEQRRIERAPTTNLTAYDYVLRGQEFDRRGTPHDADAAISLLRRARQLDPNYPEAHAALASAFGAYVKFNSSAMWSDSALTAAQRAIELDPELAAGYAELGWLLEARGDAQGALKAHLRAVQLNPNHSGGLANLYHYSFGRLDEAARWWGPALKADPTNGWHQWLAGRTYLELGTPARARPHLAKSLELNPEFWWPAYNLGIASLLEDRPEEARAQIQRILATPHPVPIKFYHAGNLATALGDSAAARRYHEQGAALPSAWPSGSLALAWILKQSGETGRVRELLQNAAREIEANRRAQPNKSEHDMDLVRLRVLQGNREDALRVMETAVQKGWRFVYDWPYDPILNSLRGDPRYDRLMAEVEADIARMRARVEREGW
ncbi:hypothetical protein BH23GEM7_BH23GEM7_32790 [soil metagenome]|jgi:TolB-like protein/Flp pilus assembly protein TadD